MKKQRRRLLKALTIGGGAITAARVPADWTSPVVDSVLLPAHAQTTGGQPLSGSAAIEDIAHGQDGSRYRDYADGSMLDRWLRPAHAQEIPQGPTITDTQIFAYAERDVSSGSGWWRVQVLIRAEVTQADIFTATAPKPMLDALLTSAYAAEPVPEFCIAERLYETTLRVASDGDSNNALVALTDSCGSWNSGFSETVAIQLRNFDDPNAATTGIVRVDPGKLSAVNLKITPGGSPLAVDCDDDACEPPSNPD